jgi:hypothetical protein
MTRNVFLAIAIVVLAWILLGFGLPYYFYRGGEQPGRGTFGDQFGAVNSLFSGLAFGVIVVALFVQARQLTHAIETQRDATLQHAKAIATQMILQVTDEIRAIEWGKAHDHLRLYHRRDKSFHESFRRRQDIALGAEHDKHRRVFLEPCYKVYNLVRGKVVDDDAARIVLTPDLILTLLEVIEPLEAIIRSNYDRSMFDWARGLYSQEELASRGAYIHRISENVELSIVGE